MEQVQTNVAGSAYHLQTNSVDSQSYAHTTYRDDFETNQFARRVNGCFQPCGTIKERTTFQQCFGFVPQLLFLYKSLNCGVNAVSGQSFDVIRNHIENNPRARTFATKVIIEIRVEIRFYRFNAGVILVRNPYNPVVANLCANLIWYNNVPFRVL